MIRVFRRIAVLALAAPVIAPVTAPVTAPAAAETPGFASHKGKFLVAGPRMPDPRFAGSVILMIAHTPAGAFGVIVNRVAARRPLGEILTGLGLPAVTGDVVLPLHWGGPVGPETVLILHSAEYRTKNTELVDAGIAVSGAREVMADFVQARGPKAMIFVVGYAGWGPGQLEGELARDDWAVVAGDPALVFGADQGAKWQRAWKMRSIDL